MRKISLIKMGMKIHIFIGSVFNEKFAFSKTRFWPKIAFLCFVSQKFSKVGLEILIKYNVNFFFKKLIFELKKCIFSRKWFFRSPEYFLREFATKNFNFKFSIKMYIFELEKCIFSQKWLNSPKIRRISKNERLAVL